MKLNIDTALTQGLSNAQFIKSQNQKICGF